MSSEPPPDVVEERDNGTGRYAIRTGEGAAEMSFSIAAPDLRIVDHTRVPRSMRRQGYGSALYAHLVAAARAEGFRIVPLCPFVSARMARHPEDADLFKV